MTEIASTAEDQEKAEDQEDRGKFLLKCQVYHDTANSKTAHRGESHLEMVTLEDLEFLGLWTVHKIHKLFFMRTSTNSRTTKGGKVAAADPR